MIQSFFKLTQPCHKNKGTQDRLKTLPGRVYSHRESGRILSRFPFQREKKQVASCIPYKLELTKPPLQYSCMENPHGQRSLAGYSPWGRKELDTTEQLRAVQPNPQVDTHDLAISSSLGSFGKNLRCRKPGFGHPQCTSLATAQLGSNHVIGSWRAQVLQMNQIHDALLVYFFKPQFSESEIPDSFLLCLLLIINKPTEAQSDDKLSPRNPQKGNKQKFGKIFSLTGNLNFNTIISFRIFTCHVVKYS